MLSVLRIQNLAIVDVLEVEFGSGLNVLTGETGAGKSIILKAIDMLAGRRTGADIIRAGSEKCTVEGLFLPSPATRTALAAENDELGALVGGEDELIVRRVVDRNGRSKIYLNGQLITAGTLSAVSARLLDITGQHHQQLLFDSAHHREMLDRFAIPAALRAAVEEKYTVFAAAKRDLDRFLTGKSNRDRELEQLRAQFDELSEARIREGERGELENELKRLASVETLGALATRAIELFDSDEQGLDTQLRAFSSTVDQALALDTTLNEIAALVDSGSVQLREARSELERYLGALEAEPERLESVRERIALIARLERKYGKKEAELAAFFEEVRTTLAQLEGGSFDEGSLRARYDQARTELDAVEKELTAARVNAAAVLAKRVESDLALLNMKRAKFEVSVRPAPSSPHGADEVEYLLAANPGEPPRPLGKVASGGELSRVLLVLKTVLNDRSPLSTTGGEKPSSGRRGRSTPKPASAAADGNEAVQSAETPFAETQFAETQIFDEVDSGVSGAVAQIVGERLFDVARRAQVILITHSPQVAAFADRHFIVEKSSSERTTTSSVRELSDGERVEQLARMLAGKKVSEHFAESARELLHARTSRLAR